MAEHIKTEALYLITELLISKFGVMQLKSLLLGDMSITQNTDMRPHKSYIRDFKHLKTPFTDMCDGHEISTELVLTALDDAANEMSYSNWHTDKFHRAAEAVIRYCEEHDIDIKFRIREE